MFDGFLEVIVRHADHGDTLLNGYPGSRPEKPGGFWVGPGPGSGITRPGKPTRVNTYPGKPTGYPGSKRTGGTPINTW